MHKLYQTRQFLLYTREIYRQVYCKGEKPKIELLNKVKQSKFDSYLSIEYKINVVTVTSPRQLLIKPHNKDGATM